LDLSRIELPDAVEELDYLTLRTAWLTDYAARMGVSVSSLDINDPIVRGLETGAYRELLIRQRINDAVRRTLLASAYGEGLDDIGADPLYGATPRLVLDPGDDEAVPPIPPVLERDDDYRARLVLAAAALSVAGPANAYEARARAAHPDAVHVAVSSPDPCEVLVEVLHDSDDPDILTDIEAALNADSVRPVGDRITVVSAEHQASSVEITIHVEDGPDLETVRLAALERVNSIVQPIAARVRSSQLLNIGDAMWTGAVFMPGVVGSEVTEADGFAIDPPRAWWPLTITVVAVRASDA
jgi:phage-related baseplate assembly protein